MQINNKKNNNKKKIKKSVYIQAGCSLGGKNREGK